MKNINGFENYRPSPFPNIAKLAHFLTDQCHHQGLSDHFQHPLDEVFDTPPYVQESLLTADVAGWGVVPDLQGREL